MRASMATPNGGFDARSTSIARQANGTFTERRIDEQTLEIRAVEITGSHIRDAPVLADLLRQIPANQKIGRATANGAYATRKCHDAIAERGAIADRGAHAVIPPRNNAKS